MKDKATIHPPLDGLDLCLIANAQVLFAGIIFEIANLKYTHMRAHTHTHSLMYVLTSHATWYHLRTSMCVCVCVHVCVCVCVCVYVCMCVCAFIDYTTRMQTHVVVCFREVVFRVIFH